MSYNNQDAQAAGRRNSRPKTSAMQETTSLGQLTTVTLGSRFGCIIIRLHVTNCYEMQRKGTVWFQLAQDSVQMIGFRLTATNGNIHAEYCTLKAFGSRFFIYRSKELVRKFVNTYCLTPHPSCPGLSAPTLQPKMRCSSVSLTSIGCIRWPPTVAWRHYRAGNFFFYFSIPEDVSGLAKLSSLTTVDAALTSNSSQSFLKFKNHRTVNAAPTFCLKDLGTLVA